MGSLDFIARFWQDIAGWAVLLDLVITPATVKEVVKRAAVLAVQRDMQLEHPPGHPNGAKLKVTADDLMLAYEQVMWSRTA